MTTENTAALEPRLVTLDEIAGAARRIAPYLSPTPLATMTPLGVRLKAESFLPIGAFKARGAFNAILSLSDVERARGVIAYSSGNHAQAVAYAAHTLGISAVVVMPPGCAKTQFGCDSAVASDLHRRASVPS